jgi:predicted Zn-dependent protease
MAVRILLVVAALVAGGWLAVQERAARAEQRLTTLAFESRGRPDAAEADRLLRAARLLNPDRRPDLFEGVIRSRQGRPADAIAVLRRATQAEAANIEAWALLASTAERRDPALAAQARAQARKLAPPVPRP